MPQFKNREEYEKWKTEKKKALKEKPTVNVGKITESIDKLEAKKKSGLMAAGLNFLLPGAGYFYCRNFMRGIIAFLLCVLVGAMSVFYPVLYPFWGIWLLFAIDGFIVANNYNKKLDERINAAMKTCPRCAEKVLPAAKVCKYCGNEFAS